MTKLEEFRDAIVPEAIAWVDALREYRQHKGEDVSYYTRARIGASVISTAARVCATVEKAEARKMLLSKAA